MAGAVLQSDFTAGELSPSLMARVDLAKYSKGCRTMRNFLVQPHGGAAKRPGFYLLDTLPGDAVLVEFTFNPSSATENYCLVFGNGWLRIATHDGFVHNNGAVYQIASPYTLEQARRLSFAQSADVLFIACRGVVPHRLMRHAHNDWRFQAMHFGAPIAAPQWAAGTITVAHNSYAPAYGPDAASEPGYSKYAFREDNSSGQYPVYTRINDNLFRVSTVYENLPAGVHFVNNAVDSAGETAAPQLVTPYTYYVTALTADGRESGLSAPADITGPAANNWQGGDYIELNWQAVPGAAEYRVYKAEYGGRPGFIATTANLYYRDNNVSPTVGEGAPKYDNPFPNGDYPECVCLFEQRLVFASSPNRPQTVWMSKSGDYTNFAAYTPVADDSPLDLTIASQEVSAARWMVPLRSLILGMAGMEWELSAAQAGAAFSAKTARATPQSYWGSSLKRALVVGNIIMHVASSGAQVRNLQYDFGSDSYGGADLSILAAHLLENRTIVDWTYQKNPDSIIWCVCSDGTLLGLTFQAEHQISAWHRHDTQGRFSSVCAVPHGHEHTLFAVIKRGNSFFLERMAERRPADADGSAARGVYLDCALTYEGAPVRVVSGLAHLEGKSVGVFSQGAVEPPRIVQNGCITLDAPSRLVTVGLQYTADLETMPVEVVGQEGASVSLKKRINAVNLFFHESLGVKAGITTEPGNLDNVRWQDVKWRTSEPYGSPPAVFSGIKQITAPTLADNRQSVCVRSDLPTPVTVLALVSRFEVRGG